MSDHIRAEFGRSGVNGILYHRGDTGAPLQRWRTALREAWAQGWPAVKVLAADAIDLVADSRVLFVAAESLRSGGPKATVPGGIALERYCGTEVRSLCNALGKAIGSGKYRPGSEMTIGVPKASGGRRPIVLMDGADRIVQKAILLVLRPVFDPRFDPRSFAFRVGRSREQAIAVARALARGGRPVWLTHDLKDAFGNVPVGRLLDVFSKHLPGPRLRALLERVLPPQSRARSGLKQGGPLSPLALELYLNHVLDKPFRRTGHDVRLVRYADDLLVACPDERAAVEADGELRKLLTPAGLQLKDPFDVARRDIRHEQAEWLGFRFRLDGERFRIEFGPSVFEKLDARFRLAHAKSRPAERTVAILTQWAAQFGPCGRWEDRAAAIQGALDRARACGFEESLPIREMESAWERARDRWRSTIRSVHKSPAYLEGGSVPLPSPLSVVR